MKLKKILAATVVAVMVAGCGGGSSGGNGNIAPTAIAKADKSIVTPGETIRFSGEESYDRDGSIVSYAWSDNGVAFTQYKVFTVNDLATGKHTMTLTVTDNEGATGSASVIVTITEEGGGSSGGTGAPVAKITSDKNSTMEGGTIRLSGSQSHDDGSITSYLWTEEDTRLGSARELILDALSAGRHYITLAVTDNEGNEANSTLLVNIFSNDENSNVLHPHLRANGKVKKTGQVKSWRRNPNVVTQTEEVTDGSIKDDGYYQMGVWSKYSYQNADKTIVKDEVTKLIWQADKEAGVIRKPWLTPENFNACQNDRTSPKCFDTRGDTAASYCTNLRLGGADDWRVPSASEMMSLVNTNFKDGYWTSTKGPGRVREQEAAYFEADKPWANATGGTYKDAPLHIRCVRGETIAEDIERNSDNETVTDKVTTLEWQDDSNITNQKTTEWGEAVDHCDALVLGGHSDWRLPNINELVSMVSAVGTFENDIDNQAEMLYSTPISWGNRLWSSSTFGVENDLGLHWDTLTLAIYDIEGTGEFHARRDKKSKSKDSGQSENDRNPYSYRCVRGGVKEE